VVTAGGGSNRVPGCRIRLRAFLRAAPPFLRVGRIRIEAPLRRR
jgi:hypothetical protein